MENKISIEELLLSQQKFSLDLKTKFETKATGYLAIVALVLSALLQFGVKGKFSTFSSLECLERINFIIYICAFLSGLFVLVICSIMLYPKRTLYFDNEKLKKLYDLRQEYDGEFDKAILSENMKCVDCNMAPINRLQNYNQIASFALIVMVLCFIICGILFLL